MPTLAQGDFPPPRSWDEFEDIVADLYRRTWDDPGGARYGRSGQPQQGGATYGPANHPPTPPRDSTLPCTKSRKPKAPGKIPKRMIRPAAPKRATRMEMGATT